MPTLWWCQQQMQWAPAVLMVMIMVGQTELFGHKKHWQAVSLWIYIACDMGLLQQICLVMHDFPFCVFAHTALPIRPFSLEKASKWLCFHHRQSCLSRLITWKPAVQVKELVFGSKRKLPRRGWQMAVETNSVRPLDMAEITATWFWPSRSSRPASVQCQQENVPVLAAALLQHILFFNLNMKQVWVLLFSVSQREFVWKMER